jgi:hypothetical protein
MLVTYLTRARPSNEPTMSLEQKALARSAGARAFPLETRRECPMQGSYKLSVFAGRWKLK